MQIGSPVVIVEAVLDAVQREPAPGDAVGAAADRCPDVVAGGEMVRHGGVAQGDVAAGAVGQRDVEAMEGRAEVEQMQEWRQGARSVIRCTTRPSGISPKGSVTMRPHASTGRGALKPSPTSVGAHSSGCQTGVSRSPQPVHPQREGVPLAVRRPVRGAGRPPLPRPDPAGPADRLARWRGSAPTWDGFALWTFIDSRQSDQGFARSPGVRSSPRSTGSSRRRSTGHPWARIDGPAFLVMM